MRYHPAVPRRLGHWLRPVAVALVVLLGAMLGLASCSSGGSGTDQTVPAASGPVAAPADFTVFESDYGVRLAYPPGYAVGGTEKKSTGFSTTITGAELSPMSEPKILVNEAPSNPMGNERAATVNIALFRVRGGEVFSRREVEVPGAVGTSIELEIVASETLRNGDILPIRAIELFFTTQDGVGVSVSVLALERDFEAARLREVISAVEALV